MGNVRRERITKDIKETQDSCRYRSNYMWTNDGSKYEEEEKLMRIPRKSLMKFQRWRQSEYKWKLEYENQRKYHGWNRWFIWKA